ncbi:MAG: hypothetical protein Q9164_004048 [Protoblastenia rupestris]
MLGQHPGDLYRLQSQSNNSNEPDLHNVAPHDERNDDDAIQNTEPSTGVASTAVPSTETSSASQLDGTWGERDVGSPVDHEAAIEDYEEMRKQLSHLSQTRSNDGPKQEI